MRLSQDIRIEQTQKLVMSTELVQAIALLQLNIQELDTYIQEQLMSNPLLEISKNEMDSKDEGTCAENIELGDSVIGDFTESISSEVDKEEYADYIEILSDKGELDSSYQYVGKTHVDKNERSMIDRYSTSDTTLREHLMTQLQLSNVGEERYKMVLYLIESLDDNGYLTISLSEFAKVFDTSEEIAFLAISYLQSFEPAGVGARDLAECLKLQLCSKGIFDDVYAKILENHLEDLANNKISQIAKKLGISMADMSERCERIKTLEPKPGRRFATSNSTKYILPDLILEKDGDEYTISLNNASTPKLKINEYYKSLFDKSHDDRELSEYLKERMGQAEWVIKSIEQRNRTIVNVATAIVRHQREFFDSGERLLKPLTLKQIAEEVGVHESTVSRGVNGKYLQALSGTYELKFFFTGGITGAYGEKVASYNIKNMIKHIIAGEDIKAPFSDQEIAEMLSRQGIEISRRTVAKYRDELLIPSSSKRKKF